MEKSLEQYMIEAERGDVNAQFKLGVWYDKGKNVQQDDSKAVEWYIKAAEQGHEKALAKLGGKM